MGKLQSKLIPAALTIGLGIVTALAFQNCSGFKNSGGTPTIVDASCDVASGCMSAASTGKEDDQQDNTTTKSVHDTTAVTNNSSSIPAVDPTTLYNFVAGDQVSCENSIRYRLDKSVVCSVGGGCGVSCGFPSTSCPSANPSYWGACITKEGKIANGQMAPPATSPDPRLLYNFISDDKATCEAAIASRGKTGTCAIGAGCGVSCGFPSATCPSANPQHWGACLK